MQEFQKKQYAFAKYLRDPENTAIPDNIEPRRIHVYRDLFFGNIKSLISQTFPVLRKFYSSEQWDALIRLFMIEHESKTPLFLEVSGEFIDYLQNTYQAQDHDPIFMLELAHYEWVELAVATADEDLDEITFTEAKCFNQVPQLNPTAWSLAYEFPVHQIGPNFSPNDKPEIPTFLLVFRTLKDKVEFMELNAISARLVEMIEQNTNKTGQELLTDIALEMQHPDPTSVISAGQVLIDDLESRNIIFAKHSN